MNNPLKYLGKGILRSIHKSGIHICFYDKVIQVCDEYKYLPYIHHYQQLIPQTDVALDAVKFRPLIKNSPYYHHGFYTQPEVFVCEIERPLFHFRTGTIATLDRRLIAESDMNAKRITEKIGVYNNYIVPPQIKFDGTYTTLMTKYTQEYSHWMIDVLPRSYGLWHWKGDTPTILMPANIPEKYRTILRYLIPDGFPIRYEHYDGWGQIERFVLSSFAVNNQSAYYPGPIRDFIRQRIFSGIGIKDDHTYHERIYITRRNAKRRLINEDEIVNYLSGLGFNIYTLEELSFEEQVRLFHSAEIVVAPHGAGLVNLLFAGPRTSVLEFFGTDHPLTWYYLLALSMSQDYYYVYSRQLVGRHDDFSIALDDVKSEMAKILD